MYKFYRIIYWVTIVFYRCIVICFRMLEGLKEVKWVKEVRKVRDVKIMLL